MPFVKLERQVELAAISVRAKSQSSSREYLHDYEIRKTVGEYAVEFISCGGECFVFRLKVTPEIVAAPTFYDMSVKEAKTKYYLHKIMNLLFPDNFPRMITAVGKIYIPTVNPNISGTFRIYVDGKTTNGYGTDYQVASEKSKYGLEKVKTAIKELELPFIPLDFYGLHHVLSADNGHYFLDTISLDTKGHWNRAKIASFMASQGHSNYQISSVMKIIDRVEYINSTVNTSI